MGFVPIANAMLSQESVQGALSEQTQEVLHLDKYKTCLDFRVQFKYF